MFIGKDTGGYGILDKNYQRERSLKIAADIGSKEARVALLNFQNEQSNAPRTDAVNASNQAIAATQADTTKFGYGVQAQNNVANQQVAQARLGIDRTNATLANQATTQQIGAAKQMQDLQTRLLTAKPEERAAIEDNLRALQGKYEKPAAADQFGTIQTGEDPVTGSKTFGTYNKQTGQVVQQGAPQQKQAFEAGKIYTDAKGNRATWNGQAFVPAK